MRKKLLAMALALSLAMTSVLPAFAQDTVPEAPAPEAAAEETVETDDADAAVTETEAALAEVAAEAGGEVAAEQTEQPVDEVPVEETEAPAEEAPVEETPAADEEPAPAETEEPAAAPMVAPDPLTVVGLGSNVDTNAAVTVTTQYSEDGNTTRIVDAVVKNEKDKPLPNTRSGETIKPDDKGNIIGDKDQPGYWMGIGIVAPKEAKSAKFTYKGAEQTLNQLDKFLVDGETVTGFTAWVNAGIPEASIEAAHIVWYDQESGNGTALNEKNPIDLNLSADPATELEQLGTYATMDAVKVTGVHTDYDGVQDKYTVTVTASVPSVTTSAPQDPGGHDNQGAVSTKGQWVGFAMQAPEGATMVHFIQGDRDVYVEVDTAEKCKYLANLWAEDVGEDGAATVKEEHGVVSGYGSYLDAGKTSSYTDGVTYLLTWGTGKSEDDFKAIRTSTYVLKLQAPEAEFDPIEGVEALSGEEYDYTATAAAGKDGVDVEIKVKGGTKAIKAEVSGEGNGASGTAGYWVGVELPAPDGAAFYTKDDGDVTAVNELGGNAVWLNAGNPDHYEKGHTFVINWYGGTKDSLKPLGKPITYHIQLDKSLKLAVPDAAACVPAVGGYGNEVTSVKEGTWKDADGVTHPVVDVTVDARNIVAHYNTGKNPPDTGAVGTYGYWVGVNLLAPVQDNCPHEAHSEGPATKSVTYQQLTTPSGNPGKLNEKHALDKLDPTWVEQMNQNHKQGSGLAIWFNANDALLKTGLVYRVEWNNCNDQRYREVYYRIKLSTTSTFAKADKADVEAIESKAYTKQSATVSSLTDGTTLVTLHAENVKPSKSGEGNGAPNTVKYWVGYNIYTPESAAGVTQYTETFRDGSVSGATKLDTTKDGTPCVQEWFDAADQNYYTQDIKAEGEDSGNFYKDIQWLNAKGEVVATTRYLTVFDAKTTLAKPEAGIAPDACYADKDTGAKVTFDSASRTVTVTATAKNVKYAISRVDPDKNFGAVPAPGYWVGIGLLAPDPDNTNSLKITVPAEDTANQSLAEQKVLDTFTLIDQKGDKKGYLVYLNVGDESNKTKGLAFDIAWCRDDAQKDPYVTFHYVLKFDKNSSILKTDENGKKSNLANYKVKLQGVADNNTVTYSGKPFEAVIDSLTYGENTLSGEGLKDDTKANDLFKAEITSTVDTTNYTGKNIVVTVTPTEYGTKAGYYGSAKANVKIAKFDLKTLTENTQVGITFKNDVAYTGKTITLTADTIETSKLNNMDAVFGVDYTLTFDKTKIQDAGDYTVTKVTGKGTNFTGSYTMKTESHIKLTVAAADMNAAKNAGTLVVTPSKKFVFSGKDQSVTPKVTFNGKGLTVNKDYKIEWTKEADAVEVSGKLVKADSENKNLNFGEGVEFKIDCEKFDISKAVIVNSDKGNTIASVEYAGQDVTLEFEDVTDQSKLPEPITKGKYVVAIKHGKDDYYVLKPGADGDYEVDYLNNNKAGTATLVIHALDGEGKHFTGTATKTFKITQLKASNNLLSDTEANGMFTLKLETKELVYNGAKQDQQVASLTYKNIKGETDTLEQGVDYTVKWSNDVNAAPAEGDGKHPTVTITLKGGYKGTLTKTYEIKALENYDIAIAPGADQTASTTKDVKPALEIKDNNGTVINRNQFKLTYYNCRYEQTGDDPADASNKLTAKIEKDKEGTYKDKHQARDEALAAEFKGDGADYGYVLVEPVNGNIKNAQVYAFNLATGLKANMVSLAYSSHAFDNTALHPEVTVKLSNTDKPTGTEEAAKEQPRFKVTYGANDAIGTGTVTVTGLFSKDNKKGLIGEVTKTFKITAAKATTKTAGDYTVDLSNTSLASAVYNGQAWKLTDEDINKIVIEYKAGTGEYLDVRNETNVDNTGDVIKSISYANNINAADATDKKAPTVKIALTGNHSGTITKTFTIAKATLTADNVHVAQDTVATGTAKSPKAVTPKVTVTMTDGTVVKTSEYKVTTDKHALYDNGTKLANGEQMADADLPKVIITSQNKNFKLVKELEGGKTETVDTIEIGYHVAPKTGTIKSAVVNGIDPKGYTLGGCTGDARDPVTLTFGENNVTVQLSKKDTTKLTFKAGDATHPEGASDSDFFVTYTNNTKKGTAKVTLTGNAAKGFGGSVTKTFKINARSIAESAVTVAFDNDPGTGNDQTKAKFVTSQKANAVLYTGKAITFNAKETTLNKDGSVKLAQDIIVKDGSHKLTFNKDYTVTYKANTNKNVGEATVIIKGKGDYLGTNETLKFNIVLHQNITE